MFLEGDLRGNLLWLCIYWRVRVFLQVSSPALSSVPFSFGSDMGDNFIVPCGACRQMMREVTACAGGPTSPDPQHLPPKHPEVQREGVVTPLSQPQGSGYLKLLYLPGKGYLFLYSLLPVPQDQVTSGNSLTHPPWGVLFLPGAEFDPRSLKMFFFLQKTSPSCCLLPVSTPSPVLGG